MSMLWFAPLAVVVAGLAVTVWALRGVDAARRDLRDEVAGMEQVRAAVALVRVESQRAHESFDRLPRR